MSIHLKEFISNDKLRFFVTPINFNTMAQYFPLFQEFVQANQPFPGLLDLTTIRTRLRTGQYLKVNPKTISSMDILNMTDQDYIHGVERMKKDIDAMMDTMVRYYTYVLASSSSSFTTNDFNTRKKYVEKLKINMHKRYQKVINMAKGGPKILTKSQIKQQNAKNAKNARLKKKSPMKKTSMATSSSTSSSTTTVTGVSTISRYVKSK